MEDGSTGVSDPAKQGLVRPKDRGAWGGWVMWWACYTAPIWERPIVAQQQKLPWVARRRLCHPTRQMEDGHFWATSTELRRSPSPTSGPVIAAGIPGMPLETVIKGRMSMHGQTRCINKLRRPRLQSQCVVLFFPDHSQAARPPRIDPVINSWRPTACLIYRVVDAHAPPITVPAKG